MRDCSAKEGENENWRGGTILALKAFCAVYSSYFLYTTFFGLVSQETHVGFYFLGTFVISFALFKFGARSPQARPSIFDFLFMLVMTGIIVYYIVEYPTLAERMGSGVSTVDAVLGWVIILLSLEMARRTVGNIIPAIGLVLLIYAYFGPYFPLGLGHAGFSLPRIAESLFLSGDGILGTMTNIFASYILIFVILGAFMEVSGCGRVFVDLAYAITGRVTGGPALASVITSALFGTVSGSAVANVVVDGVYTIPLMKRMGYKPHFAGAVEAATSTGGQLMPPVMGAAAFLLAEISGTPYITVIKIAAIPAILYYASVAVIIRLEAVKQNLQGLPASELPKFGNILRELHLLLPVPILIVLLAFDMTPFIAAFYTIVATIIVSWFRKETRMGFAKIVEALYEGARGAVSVGSIVGVLGIVMGVCSLTGLPNYFSQFIIYLSGGYLFSLVLLIIIAGLFIGMGLPDDPLVRHPGDPGGPGHGQDGGRAADRPHDRPLGSGPVQRHPAGGLGRHRGRGDRQERSLQDGLGGLQARLLDLPHAVPVHLHVDPQRGVELRFHIDRRRGHFCPVLLGRGAHGIPVAADHHLRADMPSRLGIAPPRRRVDHRHHRVRAPRPGDRPAEGLH